MDEKNDNRPATLADLNAMQKRVAADINASEQRLAGRIEHVETTLLTEFHKWAQTYEIRSRGVTNLVHTFEERLGVLEERVSALERRRT